MMLKRLSFTVDEWLRIQEDSGRKTNAADVCVWDVDL